MERQKLFYLNFLSFVVNYIFCLPNILSSFPALFPVGGLHIAFLLHLEMFNLESHVCLLSRSFKSQHMLCHVSFLCPKNSNIQRKETPSVCFLEISKYKEPQLPRSEHIPWVRNICGWDHWVVCYCSITSTILTDAFFLSVCPKRTG